MGGARDWVQRVAGTASASDRDAEYVATGAGGGLVSGAAVVAKQTLNHEAATRVADNASLITRGDPYLRKGNIALHARATTDAAMHVKLNTGGAIQAPFTKSETFLNSSVTASLGQNTLVRSTGGFALTTSVDHKVLNEALTKTYGAIGIAGGRSVTELIANEFVTVGSGADIFAWDDINIGTGMDAQGAAINLIGARAITDVYNYALIPITPELDAEASAVDNATVTVAGGARVRSVRDVRIGSRRGLSDAKTVAAGHNPYSESTHEVINTPGNELVKYDHRLKVDGSVMAEFAGQVARASRSALEKMQGVSKRRLDTLMAAIAENPLPDDFLSDASRQNNPPKNPFADWDTPKSPNASAKASAKRTAKTKARK